MAGAESNMVKCEGCGEEFDASNPAEAAAHAGCSPEHIEQA
jgi:hypothetical protein